METAHVRQERNHMATTFEFVVSCEPARASLARRALSRAHEEVARLERELSEFLPESPVYRLNRAAPGEPVAFTEDGLRLLELAGRMRERTRGAFDCTAKSVCAIPPGERLEVDATARTVSRRGEGVRVGFGAIGKGYALDRVRALLEREGFRDYLLSGGGSSLVFSGFSKPGIPWTWAWSWDRAEDGSPLGVPFAHPTGATVAVGVSGLHHKGEHILDPRDGSRALGPKSALVAHPSAAAADALSTALFVAGWDEGFPLLEDPAAEPAAAMIDSESVPRWNGIFDWLWGAPAALALVAAALPGVTLAQDEAVDLSALGADDFAPYVIERDAAWIALPLLMIGVVLLHLIRPRKKLRKANPEKPIAKGEA